MARRPDTQRGRLERTQPRGIPVCEAARFASANDPMTDNQVADHWMPPRQATLKTARARGPAFSSGQYDLRYKVLSRLKKQNYDLRIERDRFRPRARQISNLLFTYRPAMVLSTAAPCRPVPVSKSAQASNEVTCRATTSPNYGSPPYRVTASRDQCALGATAECTLAPFSDAICRPSHPLSMGLMKLVELAAKQNPEAFHCPRP